MTGGGNMLRASKLSSSTNNASLLRSGVLRPSAFNASTLTPPTEAAADTADDDKAVQQNNAHTARGLEQNPFLKEEADTTNSELTENEAKDAEPQSVAEDAVESEAEPDPLSLLLASKPKGRANLFAAAKEAAPRFESTGFVFGQNLHERVVGDNINVTPTSSVCQDKLPSDTKSSSMLFSNAIALTKTDQQEVSSTSTAAGCTAKEPEPKSLDEIAREYEESRAQKRKYEEVETFTGEEDEKNIADISCKLFAFCNSNYEERGRGNIRLNDSKSELRCSRVVFRTSGTLRLLVNTKVWPGMVVERPSQKTLRFTAMDSNGKVLVFLIMARPAEIIDLFDALSTRIALSNEQPTKSSEPVSDNNGNDEEEEASGPPPVHTDNDDITPCPPKKILTTPAEGEALPELTREASSTAEQD